MDTIRLKYEGDKPRLETRLDFKFTWNPGDVRIFPKRVHVRSPLPDFKIMKGRHGNDDIPLPMTTAPDGLCTPRELEMTMAWYTLDDLRELISHYSQQSMRQHRDVVEQEIDRREGDGETD